MNENKVVWIIGATGGIGRCIVSNLKNEDWIVVGSARDEINLENLSDEMGIKIHPVDARNNSDMQEIANSIKEEYGRIDAVVLAVGTIFLRPTHATSSEQFMDTVEQNLLTAHNVINSTAKIMMKEKSGRIILFSSAAASVGMPNHGAISASKAGLEGLARATASEYAKRGIRINVVSPGLTDTPLASKILSSDSAREISNNKNPSGRIGLASEVGDVASWLVSQAPDWITGEVIHVDGGLSNIT